MAMAIPAAEVLGAEGGETALGAAAKKTTAKKSAAKKTTPSSSSPAKKTPASGGAPAKKTAPAKKSPAKAQGAGERQQRSAAAEQRAANREQRAAQSHANRQADRQAKLSPPSAGRGKQAVAWAWSGNRKLLTAEFLVCVVVLGLGTLLAPQGSKDGMPRAMVKGSALSGLFLILALVASGGKGAAKVATALGTLVTASYVLTSSDVHNVVQWISSFYSKTGDVSAKNPAGTGPVGAELGSIAGGVNGDIGSTDYFGPVGTAPGDVQQQTVNGVDEGTTQGDTYTSTTGFTY